MLVCQLLQDLICKLFFQTGCKPDLVCYAKQDSSEKLDSKQDSRKRDSAAALKSQNIHSAYGKSNPFFAKDNSVSHDASEFIERNRKSKADELSQVII